MKKKCLKCGAVYEDDSLFCQFEGEKLVEFADEPPAPVPASIPEASDMTTSSTERRCPKCNSVNSNEDKFCFSCGAQLTVAAPVPAAPAPVAQQISMPTPVPAVNQPQIQPATPIQVPNVPVAQVPTQPQQPVASAPFQQPQQFSTAAPNAYQQPQQPSGKYNYGMSVIEKVVIGILIGIIVLAIVLGVLFITGVLGRK